MADIREFIEKHGISYKSIDISALIGDYLDEMQRGLNGKSSLLMVPSYVNTDGEVKRDTPVCVVDAGGTNLRAAKMMFGGDGKPLLLSKIDRYEMPGSKGAITADEFYETLCGYMLPHLEGTQHIALSFAYPIEITPELDGIVLHMDKEVVITGIEGSRLAASLKERLAKKGFPNMNIVIINDSVATCLSGMAEKLGQKYSSFTGTIFGTGNNSCYIENAANIGKISGRKGGMIINTEAGGYGRQPRTDLDIAFDASTADPGAQTCEKQVSGGYLGPLFGFMLKKAAVEGYFSAKMRGITDVRSVDIDALLRSGGGIVSEYCANEADRKNAVVLAENLCKRAARLCALQMAAIAEKSYKKNGGALCMTVEGSTYYKLLGMKAEVDGVLCAYLESRGISADIIEVEHAVLKGCAIAGLL